MAADATVSRRPLGRIAAMLARIGLEITHAYDDLVFIEHNAFLLRFEAGEADISLFFNDASAEANRAEIAETLEKEGREQGLDVKQRGTYQLSADESTETLQISFYGNESRSPAAWNQ